MWDFKRDKFEDSVELREKRDKGLKRSSLENEDKELKNLFEGINDGKERLDDRTIGFERDMFFGDLFGFLEKEKEDRS